jgi:hypothetical protein
MNNTTATARAAAIVVIILISVMLVVGAGTLAAISGQSTAFAYSNKKDNGKGGGNGNSNTITLQKCKQAAIQSGFDNNQAQDCKNTICTHPGDNATCVQEGVTIPTSTAESTPPPTTGTLRVIKKVVCLATDPDCTLPALCEITVAEQRTNPFITHTFECESAIEDGVLLTLQPGKFFVIEGLSAISFY